MPDECKDPDPVVAYRNCIQDKLDTRPGVFVWNKGTDMPSWLTVSDMHSSAYYIFWLMFGFSSYMASLPGVSMLFSRWHTMKTPDALTHAGVTDAVLANKSIPNNVQKFPR